MDSAYIKEGWKTTEFWTMLSSVGFGVLMISGIMSNTESNVMLAYINNIMGSGVTIVSVASYIFSRGKAKSKNVDYDKLIEDITKIVERANMQKRL